MQTLWYLSDIWIFPVLKYLFCDKEVLTTLLHCCAGNPGSRVKSFAVSSNGKVGVTVLFDSSISVWDLKTMQVRHPPSEAPARPTLTLAMHMAALSCSSCQDAKGTTYLKNNDKGRIMRHPSWALSGEVPRL